MTLRRLTVLRMLFCTDDLDAMHYVDCSFSLWYMGTVPSLFLSFGVWIWYDMDMDLDRAITGITGAITDHHCHRHSHIVHPSIQNFESRKPESESIYLFLSKFFQSNLKSKIPKSQWSIKVNPRNPRNQVGIKIEIESCKIKLQNHNREAERQRGQFIELSSANYKSYMFHFHLLKFYIQTNKHTNIHTYTYIHACIQYAYIT